MAAWTWIPFLIWVCFKAWQVEIALLVCKTRLCWMCITPGTCFAVLEQHSLKQDASWRGIGSRQISHFFSNAVFNEPQAGTPWT